MLGEKVLPEQLGTYTKQIMREKGRFIGAPRGDHPILPPRGQKQDLATNASFWGFYIAARGMLWHETPLL